MNEKRVRKLLGLSEKDRVTKVAEDKAPCFSCSHWGNCEEQEESVEKGYCLVEAGLVRIEKDYD